jgi:hypothetical protein
MNKAKKLRFWTELSLASASGGLCILTLVWHEWIELLFGVDPDGGDGSLEWAIVAASFAVAVTLSIFARIEWRTLAT